MGTSTNTPWWVCPNGDYRELLLHCAAAGWKMEVPCDFETVGSGKQEWSNFCYHPEQYQSCLSVFESSKIVTCIIFAQRRYAFISKNSISHDNIYIYCLWRNMQLWLVNVNLIKYLSVDRVCWRTQETTCQLDQKQACSFPPNVPNSYISRSASCFY